MEPAAEAAETNDVPEEAPKTRQVGIAVNNAAKEKVEVLIPQALVQKVCKVNPRGHSLQVEIPECQCPFCCDCSKRSFLPRPHLIYSKKANGHGGPVCESVAGFCLQQSWCNFRSNDIE